MMSREKIDILAILYVLSEVISMVCLFIVILFSHNESTKVTCAILFISLFGAFPLVWLCIKVRKLG